MFAEWVTQGARIGIEAFTALFVFALICFMIYGAIAVFGAFFGGGKNDADNEKRDTYRG